jgi:hypothetical protein
MTSSHILNQSGFVGSSLSMIIEAAEESERLLFSNNLQPFQTNATQQYSFQQPQHSSLIK